MHDTELTIASHYSYAVFARDASGNTSTAVIMTTGTRDSGADVCATPLTRDTTWSSDYRDTYTIHCTLSVPSGVKLTITAGTVVKFSQGSGLSLRSGGSLIGAGSETSPVVFTSWRDDSVGGDTNNDGGATTAKAGDWGQIAAERGATLDLSQVQVSFGDLVSGSSATVSVRNSLVSDNRHGGLQVSGSSNSDPPPVIQGNQFLRNGGPETACSTVSDLDPAVVVDFGYQGRLDLGQITGNTGTGNGYDAVFVSGRLGAGEQIWPSNGLAMVVGDDPGWYCNPDRQYSNGSLIVPSGTTLRMPAGSVAKFANMYTGAGSVVVESGGSLIGAGSETSPVVFTSWRDDSVGGDTNNDGGATTAKAGDWGQIAAERGATLDLSQVHLSWGSGLSLEWTSGESTARFEAIDLRHQTQGITVGDGWKVTIRGSISDVPGRYVHACNWSQKCAVDATNVSWGTPSGPFPAGHPTLVCGAVAIDPWVGMPTDHKSYLFNVPNCDGSTTPDVPVESARQAFNQRMSAYQELCALSQDACEQVDRMQRCYAAALDLAKPQSVIQVRGLGPGSRSWV